MNPSLLRITVLAAASLFIAGSLQAAPTYCDAECDFDSCSTQACTDPETEESITCKDWGTYDTSDLDCDGVLNGPDNCDTVANSNQADCDGDGQGDVCDSENGTFVYLYGSTCYVNGSNYGVFSKIRTWRETWYQDTSSCNAPDKAVTTYSGSHTCLFTSASDCCVATWGTYICNLYYDNDQCP